MAVESPSRNRSKRAFEEISQYDSSSTQQSQQPFEVFINHRGPDVKLKLASTIYNTLKILGVTAFLDQEELDVSVLIPQGIENAMRSAQIHIAIFSKGYAKSPWCLAELLFMQKQTQAPIIPIFYDVEPSDLKWGTRGSYAKAFTKHEEKGRYSLETLEKWKNALDQAASLVGHVFKSNRDDEGLLLKTVVNRVTREIMKLKLPFSEPRHPVGLDKAVDEFGSFLESDQVHQSVKIVGIAGIRGCGKTTLARKFCNERYSMFDSYSFLSDVRKAALIDKVKKLLLELVHINAPPLKDANELKTILAGRLKNKSPRVLIVLDDVDHLDQVYNLLPDEGLGSGSLIIVTTGDKSVLQRRGISTYEMEALCPCHAKELFCRHAFLLTSPPAGFEDLVQDFINFCGRLPLFIEVIAGMLFSKPAEKWRSKLNEIRSLNCEEKQKLRHIYDELQDEEKYIFLDVACFFVGEKKNLAITVWEADERKGLEALENLVNKCLVDIDKKNRIRMNGLLRDLGKQIAIESRPPRLWHPDHITRIIEYAENMGCIRGVMAATTQLVARSGRYKFPECCDFYDPPFQECMYLGSKILQLLVVAGDYFTSDFAILSAGLVWLRWFNFQHTNVPSWLSMPKLKVLELYGASSLQDLWQNDVHARPPKELRQMIITATEGNSFPSFPSQISGLKHLTKIALISCYGLEFRFTKLPDEFCQLKSLEHLELRQCTNLSSLPIRFGDLCKLRHLDFFSCKMLRKFPLSFKELVNLEYLNLSGCEKLSPMPEILEKMTKLKNLYFSGHAKLKKLPLQIVEQKFLRKLHLKKTGLQNLPSDIDQLSSLEKLVIGSPHLTVFPESLGNLSSLTRLKITGCVKLESLPESVERLKHLEYLFIKSCKKMGSLPEGLRRLPNLQVLKIFDCPIAELDVGSGSCSSLRKLKVIHLKATDVTRLSITQSCCPNLEILQLEKNSSLERVRVPEAVKLVNVPESVQIVRMNANKKKGSIKIQNAKDA